MIKITIEKDEDGMKHSFVCEMPNESTWTGIIENGVIPALRALTYALPETDNLMEAIEVVGHETTNFSSN